MNLLPRFNFFFSMLPLSPPPGYFKEINSIISKFIWSDKCPRIKLTTCDEWGGAESRGNGARPVELMVMSDTCATHRSRVPRRSSGRIKGGVTTEEDERGPGLDFSLCFVCGSRP